MPSMPSIFGNEEVEAMPPTGLIDNREAEDAMY
jgi:hypothetical protein